MLHRLLSAALVGFVLLLAGSPAFAYFSKDSYEGDVTFTGRVEIADDTPDFLIEPSYISRQLLYLAGPLQAAPRRAASAAPGLPPPLPQRHWCWPAPPGRFRALPAARVMRWTTRPSPGPPLARFLFR